MKKVLALSCALVTGNALATTWMERQVPDPLGGDASCRVHVPASYGSYIYGWPSKYDQVFWPLTVDQGIWFCEQSGFIAFIRDFDGLTDGERGAIKAYLEKHYQGPLDTRQKLALLEAVYVLREKPDDFRNKLVRVLARWYQDLGDHEKANQLRGQALAQMREALAGDLPEPTRLEYVYVSCNYDVLLGNDDGEGLHAQGEEGDRGLHGQGSRRLCSVSRHTARRHGPHHARRHARSPAEGQGRMRRRRSRCRA